MGEATKGKGFSSSLSVRVYALSACGTIVRVNPEKLVRVEIKFDACAVSVDLFSL